MWIRCIVSSDQMADSIYVEYLDYARLLSKDLRHCLEWSTICKPSIFYTCTFISACCYTVSNIFFQSFFILAASLSRYNAFAWQCVFSIPSFDALRNILWWDPCNDVVDFLWESNTYWFSYMALLIVSKVDWVYTYIIFEARQDGNTDCVYYV